MGIAFLWEAAMMQAQESTHAPGEALRPWTVYLAYAVLAYPIVPLLALYGEWGLAWFHLGHQPLPSANDPKFIDGSSWMHPVVGLAYLGSFPMGFAAMLVYVPFITRNHKSWLHQAFEAVAIPCLWAGTVALLVLDPWGVRNWWLD